MKLKTILYISCIALGTSLTGCSDELEQKNPNQTSTDSYWSDLDQTEAGVNATLAVLRDPTLININVEAARADLAWPGYGRPTPSLKNWCAPWYYKTFTTSDKYLVNNWSALYRGVFRANQVIEALNRLEGTVEDEARWTEQMGQARFMRGLMYFYLHSAYNKGSVAILDHVPTGQEDFYNKLSPASEVKTFFRADMEYAYENLPAKWELNSDLGRPTAGAAATILGTSYLYDSDYTAAAEYFEDVITNPAYGYALAAAEDMFNSAVEFNSESILEISYNASVHPETSIWDPNTMRNIVGMYTRNMLFGFYVPAWLTYEYRAEQQDPKAPGYDASQMLSKRARAMVAIKGDHTPYYGKTTEAARLKGGEVWGFGFYKKYTSHDIMDEKTDKEGTGKNIVLNRLSDVYLMYAECMVQQGQIETALDYINRVRKRWELVLLGPVVDPSRTYDGLTYTKQSIMEHLMYKERPLELSTEGFEIRWCDLRRWGVTKQRFRDLAAKTFYLVDFDKEAPAKKYIKTPEELTELTDNIIVDYEYDQTAINYSDALHGYLPIPVNETSNNPNIN